MNPIRIAIFVVLACVALFVVFLATGAVFGTVLGLSVADLLSDRPVWLTLIIGGAGLAILLLPIPISKMLKYVLGFGAIAVAVLLYMGVL
jgi:hypothetical protein